MTASTISAAIFAWVWPFAAGMMLLWAAAALIPLIIHLLSRRRQDVTPWAAMEFLMAAVKKRARRLRIEQLILLLLRMAILLLLALAMADPFWPLGKSLGPSFSGRESTHWVIVIDGSYSMDYRDDEKTRFEQAKELAAELVQSAPRGDAFSIVLMAEPPREVIGDPAFDPRDVQAEIELLEQPHGGADLPAALSAVQNILSAAASRHGRLESAKVCIFSDLGANTWESVESPESGRLLDAISRQAAVVLIEQGRSGGENLAVTNLATREPLLSAGREATIEATVENLGRRDRSDARIELLVDGEPAAAATLEVPAGTTATAVFRHRFSAPGEHSLEARLAADRLGVDNHRYLPAPVRPYLTALCVEGKPGDARLVAYGLDPFQSDPPRVKWRIATQSALLEDDLSQFDAVFLCNVGRLDENEAALLHTYVSAGGGLVLFLGDQVRAESYNSALAAGPNRLLPARLGDASGEGEYFLAAEDFEHPILAPFRGNENSGLFTLPTWRYVRLVEIEEAEAKQVLSFTSGDPALLEERFGRGRVLLFASAASPESIDRSTDPPLPWTAVPTGRNYPVLIQTIYESAVRGRDAARQVTVGEPLEGIVPGNVGSPPLLVVDPGGNSERVQLTVEEGDSVWEYADTSRSGFYEARFGPPLSRSQIYGVNVNSGESDPARYDAELLPPLFQRDLSVEPDGRPAFPSSRPPELFRYVLALLLFCLFGEMTLACFFGRGMG